MRLQFREKDSDDSVTNMIDSRRIRIKEKNAETSGQDARHQQKNYSISKTVCRRTGIKMRRISGYSEKRCAPFDAEKKEIRGLLESACMKMV